MDNGHIEGVSIANGLIARIENKSAKIGVIGLGYVGLPLALRFVEVGFRVLGFDIDADKVGKLNRGQPYIERLRSERIALARKRHCAATTDYGRVAEGTCLQPL